MRFQTLLDFCEVVGISISEFNRIFSVDFEQKYSETLKKKAKYLDRNADRLTIKPEYLYVQNDIILSFMQG